jgi:hypothetical protein
MIALTIKCYQHEQGIIAINNLSRKQAQQEAINKKQQQQLPNSSSK